MKTIDEIISDVLVREGWPTVTDRPSDKGGLTRGGITFANYNAWLVSIGRAPITAEQFRSLTEADARAFLVDQFSRPFTFVSGDPDIFVQLVDWAVTSGPDAPAHALQAALTLHAGYTGAVDGVPGPKTKAAWMSIANDFGACALIDKQLVSARVSFYLDCALHDPAVAAFRQASPNTDLENVRGWINRALEFF